MLNTIPLWSPKAILSDTLMSVLGWIWGAISSAIVQKKVCDAETANIVLNYLNKRYKIVQFFSTPFLSAQKENKQIPQYGSLCFKRKTELIWTEPTEHPNADEVDCVVFNFIYGTVDWEGLFTAAFEYHNSNQNRFYVKIWAPQSSGFSIHKPSNKKEHFNASGLVLSKDLEEILSEAQFWKNQESWYRERQIPWKRGYLFYGQPGTGKTSFAKTLAKQLNIPLIIIDLAGCDNEDLRSVWMRAAMDAPALVLLEDLDAVFEKRVNVNPEGCTFDCLLQCMDGAYSNEGIITIITTNHPERFDSALGVSVDGLASRPGRIDRIVAFDSHLSEEGRKQIAGRILQGGDTEQITQIVQAGINDTPAQFQERCVQIALKAHYGK